MRLYSDGICARGGRGGQAQANPRTRWIMKGNIWPMSTALPWLNRMVYRGVGTLSRYAATTLPDLVGSRTQVIVMLSPGGRCTPRPPRHSESSSVAPAFSNEYDAGSGGKKACLATMMLGTGGQQNM